MSGRGSRNHGRSRRGNRRQHTDNSAIRAILQRIDETNRVELTQQRAFLPHVLDVKRIKIPEEQYHMFERAYIGPPVTVSATTPSFGSIAVSLSSLPNYTEYTTLFDEWRVMELRVCFAPAVTMSSGSTTSSLFTVFDYDDSNNFTSITDALQYETMQQSFAGSGVERVLHPFAAQPMYANGVVSGYAREPRSSFMDAATPNIQYYGLKWAIDTNTTALTLWTTTIFVVIQLRNVR